MPPATVEFFLPRQAKGTDLAVWCALFSQGQSEVSGDPPRAEALAERLRAEEEHPVVRRWAARDNDDGRIVGTAQLRPQPHDQRIGFLRLFVAPSARRRDLPTQRRQVGRAFGVGQWSKGRRFIGRARGVRGRPGE